MTNPQQAPQNSNLPSRRVRIAGMILPALFIGVLIAVTGRIASPQTESIWSVYETPGDLIRIAWVFPFACGSRFTCSFCARMQKRIGPGYISVSPFCPWRSSAPSSFGDAQIGGFHFRPSLARRSKSAFYFPGMPRQL
jgi:hypothetical protein